MMTLTRTPSRQSRSPGESDAAAPLGRRERNKLEKRARIVGAARALFATQGFSETTTSQIAEAAGIGTGTLFLYARTKEDLLFLVFKDEMLETAQDSFRNLPQDAGSVDQLMQVFDRMVDYHERDVALTRILLREIITPGADAREDELDELMGAIYSGFAQLVRKGQAAGRIPDRHDPDLTGRSIFAIYYLGLLNWLGGRATRAEFLSDLRLQLAALLAPNA
jgi:AcrR family transcriptional regulator